MTHYKTHVSLDVLHLKLTTSPLGGGWMISNNLGSSFCSLHVAPLQNENNSYLPPRAAGRSQAMSGKVSQQTLVNPLNM